MKTAFLLLALLCVIVLNGCERKHVSWVLSSDRALLVDDSSHKILADATERHGAWEVTYPSLDCVFTWSSDMYTDLPSAMHAINKRCRVKESQ